MARHQHRQRKRSSLLARIALGTLFVVLFAFAALMVFRIPLMEFGLKTALENSGAGPVTFEIKRLGLDRTEIGPVTIAGEVLRIDQINAEYDLIPALFQNALVSLEIDGFHLRGQWTDQGMSFGALDHTITALEQDGTEEDSAELQGSTSLNLGRVKIADAMVTVDGLRAPLTAYFDVDLEATQTVVPLSVSGTLSGPGLSGSVQWNGSIDTADLAASNGSGVIKLEANAFALPGSDQRVNANLDVTTTLSDSAFDVTLTDDITLELPWPAFDLPIDIPKNENATLSISVRSNAPGARFISVEQEGEEITGRSDMALEWSSPAGTGQVELAGRVLLGADHIPRDFRFDRLSFAVTDLPSPFGSVDATFVGDGLQGPVAMASGPVKLHATVKQGTLGEVRYESITVDSDSTLRMDGLAVVLDVATLDTQVSGLHYADLAEFEETLIVSLAAGAPNAQTVTTKLGAEGNATLTLDLGMALDSGTVKVGAGDTPINGKVAFPNLSVEGMWDGRHAGLDVQFSERGGSLLSSVGNVTALAINSQMVAETLEGTANGQLTLNPARDANRPGVPFSAEFSLINGQLTLTGDATLTREQTLARFSVAYDTNAESGYVTTSIGPLLFGGSDIRPSDIAPLGLPVTPLSGEVYADTKFRLGNSDVTESGSVLVRDLEVETGEYRFQRINTALELSNVWPPGSAPNQQLAIGLMQAGVPLTNIVASYGLSSADAVNIDTLSMELAGGTISSGALAFKLDGSDSIATFRVNDVRLDQLALLSGLPGLSAEGLLSGDIPVRLVPGDAIIENGRLTTNAPGSIRYIPDASTAAVAESQSGYGLALQALEDFQYESLSLTVNGSLSKDLEVGLQLKGKNPALYDGYPIEFNLNLSGELANVIQGSLAGYRVPETIKRQLLEFPQTQ